MAYADREREFAGKVHRAAPPPIAIWRCSVDSRRQSLHDWDPPFPIELKRVRPRDEDYWALRTAEGVHPLMGAVGHAVRQADVHPSVSRRRR